MPWFSKCGKGSSASIVIPDMPDGVVGQAPEPFLPNPPSAGPVTSPPSLYETVSVSICLKAICYTFEVQSKVFTRSILEAGEYLYVLYLVRYIPLFFQCRQDSHVSQFLCCINVLKAYTILMFFCVTHCLVFSGALICSDEDDVWKKILAVRGYRKIPIPLAY